MKSPSTPADLATVRALVEDAAHELDVLPGIRAALSVAGRFVSFQTASLPSGARLVTSNAGRPVNV